MPELGTAWVTLAISTKNMERDIKRAFSDVEKSAKLSPDVDTSKMSAKASRAGQSWRDLFSRSAKSSADVDTDRLSGKASGAGRRFADLFSRSAKATPDVDTSKMSAKASAAGAEFGARFSSGAKSSIAALGVAGVASTVISQFKQVMSVGMDWTKNMNTLRAVTGASADQMTAAAAAARQLGTDITLPATSANDAAAAMTELAKGGLNVTEAMNATKGALQLAAAGGLEAAQAATIQADALNTFQLGAEQANHVADLLANAANASSGEVTDMAQALAQAGSVAAGFGVSIDDTMTSLAMFAKFGVKGSDAGTMMKTSLQAITDGGKPAQAAIDELGLKLYDTAGKFVGYPEMLKQVADASKNMSQEQFQAATNVLFGSDAMRASMIAANGGAKAFDGLREKVTKAGGAAEVAAAKTQGLPGAWERVKNAMESLQLKAYDAIDGPASKLLDALSGLMDGIGKAGESPAFKSIADAVKSAAPGIKDIATSLAKAAGAVGAAAWAALTTALSGVAQVLKVLAPLLNAVGSFMKENQGLVTAFVGAWAAFKFLPGILSPVKTALENITATTRNMKSGVTGYADGWRSLTGALQQADPTLSGAGARLSALKMESSTLARSGFNVLKAGVGGLVGALGGPLGIALTGATVAFGAIASKNAEATAAADAYAAAVKQTATDQISLNEALLKSNGLLDENARLQAAKQVQDAQGELDTAAKSQASFLDKFRDSQGSLIGGFFDGGNAPSMASIKDDTAAKAAAAKQAIEDLNISQQRLEEQITGGQPAFDSLVASLKAQGEGGELAAQKFTAVRESILKASQAGSVLGPALQQAGLSAEESASKIAEVSTALAGIPADKPIDIQTPNGQQVLGLLTQLNIETNKDNTKEIEVTAPLAPDQLRVLEALNLAVRTDNGKTIIVKQEGAEETDAAITKAARDRTATITIISAPGNGLGETGTNGGTFGDAQRQRLGITRNAEGSIQGAPRLIEKPQQADIYQGQGAGTIFAEEETGGEAYIPLAPAKRDRSTQILAEVAKIFGFSLAKSGATATTTSVSGVATVGDTAGGWAGAITGPIVSVLQQILAAVSTSRSSSSTVSLAGSDAELLARVPTGGSYSAIGDLSMGLADCTSGIEDLVNMMDGASTSGRSMATGNAAEWLTAHGFLPTDSPVAGAFNVGYNSHHMEGTLPGGTNVNYGSDASVASGGTAGAAGAWGDPSFTEHYYRPVGDAWSKLAKSSEKLTSTLDERTDAETKLTDAASQQADTATQQKSDNQKNTDASSLGQSLFSGVLQGMGLDGSVFSNPFEWSNTKSLTALANWGGGLLQGVLGGSQSQDGSPSTDAGVGGIPGIPNLADLLKPLPDGSMQPQSLPDAQHQGTGAQPGPSVVVNGNVGMDPRAFTQRIDAHQNQAYRRNLNAVRP